MEARCGVGCTGGRGERSRDVRGAFEAFDNDGNGSMDLDEFKAAVEFLQIPVNEVQVTSILAKFDDAGDGNGTLEIEEFQQLINYFRQVEEMVRKV